jgi:hypothetical protein
MPISDCEAIGNGLLLQPVNTVSSLAFVVVGGLVGARVGRSITLVRTTFAGVLMFVGLGSVGFHGWGGSVAGWAHDVSLSALFLLVLAVELGMRQKWTSARIAILWVVPAACLAVLTALAPGIIDALNAVLVAPAVGAVLWRVAKGRVWAADRAAVAGLGLLLLGATVMALSRSGGPLCAEASVLQGHAVWHVLAAAGIGLYAANVVPRFRNPP